MRHKDDAGAHSRVLLRNGKVEYVDHPVEESKASVPKAPAVAKPAAKKAAKPKARKAK